MVVRKEGGETYSDRISSIAPEEVVGSRFELAEPPDKDVIAGRFEYTDISHAGYSTIFMIRVSKQPPDLLTQMVEMHGPITFWWQMVVPRRFRHYLWPLTKRVLKRRGYKVP